MNLWLLKHEMGEFAVVAATTPSEARQLANYENDVKTIQIGTAASSIRFPQVICSYLGGAFC